MLRQNLKNVTAQVKTDHTTFQNTHQNRKKSANQEKIATKPRTNHGKTKSVMTILKKFHGTNKKTDHRTFNTTK